MNWPLSYPVLLSTLIPVTCYTIMSTILDSNTFNWHQLLLGNEAASFLYAVILRAIAVFLVVLISARILGKRGVKQLSVFELVIILTLGSAAGDPMVYGQVGIITCVVVFVMVLLLYRITIYFAGRSHRFTVMIKGRPVYLIKDGSFCENNFRNQPLAFDEFFAELRQKGVTQLGQIKNAIIETTGDLSVFYYPDEEVKWGLPILPDPSEKHEHISEEDFYSCVKCAQTARLNPGSQSCSRCGHRSWLKASNERRIS